MEVTEWEIFSIFLFASSLWSIYLNSYSIATTIKSYPLVYKYAKLSCVLFIFVFPKPSRIASPWFLFSKCF